MNNENMAGKCSLTIYDTEQLMGEATARKIASSLKKQASLGKKTVLWLMAAPSAFAFYTAFTKMVAQDEKLKDVVTKTQFFQFDDYPIDKDSPKYVATFRYLLETKFFNGLSEACKKPLHVNLLNVKGDEHDAEVLDAYAKKIQGLCMDDSYYVIQLKGIGMDGHWGFHGASFPLDLPPTMIKVAMESQNIYQQMVDWPSLYPTVDDVPKTAYTGTVNLFMLADEIYDNVPQASKLFSVLATYGTDDVIQDIPSSKLKEHPNSHALLTKDSASLLQAFREKRAKDPQYTLTSDEHKRLVALWGDDSHTQDNCKKMDEVLKKLGII